MRVLLIGSGSIGKRHMRNLRMLRPEVRFDVLRERSLPSHGLDFAERCTISSSLDEALDKAPQLMIIANPSALHLPYLTAAITRSIPFYAEKPVVSSVEDLSSLAKCLSAVRELPANIVGCNLRFLPSLIAMKDMVDTGVLGNICYASFEAGQWLPDWRPGKNYRESYSAQRNLGGGVALDLIHEVDSARWLIGDFGDVKGMFASSSSLEIDVEDTASFLMKADRGAIVSVNVNYVSRSPFRRYRVVGDEGTVEWDLPNRALRLSTASSTGEIPLAPDAFDVDKTYVTAMSDLLRAVENGGNTSQSLAEGVAALELVFRSLTFDPIEARS